jgi:very-short-patch-repair endonuclease
MKKEAEDEFAFQIVAYRLPPAEREFQEIPTRRFRWDFAWVKQRLLVEINGSTWVANTGHTSGMGIARDYEKSNLAVLAGWRCLTVTPQQVRNGEAVLMAQEALRD